MSLKEFLKSRKFILHLSLIVVFFILCIYVTMLLLKVYTHHGKSLNVPDFIGLTENEVKIITKENKLRYNIIDSLFVPDAIPGTIIAQHPGFNQKVKQRRTIYLTISAISPEKVLMPVVVDVSLREAKSRLENAGLRLGQVTQQASEFVNLVLDQSINGMPIPKDTMLNKGSYIDLVVGIGLSNERTSVPDLFGLYINEAKEALYNVSLNTGAMIYDQSVLNADDSLNAQVWKQNPLSDQNKLVGLGTSVDLWLTVDREKIDINETKE